MDNNVEKGFTNFIEKSCNDLTKNIIGGFTSPIEKNITIIPNIINDAPLLGEVTTSYIIFGGYELSSPVFIIMIILLLLISLYIIYKLYNCFFSSKNNNFVSIKKINKNKKNNSDSESENDSDLESDLITDDNSN